MNIRKSNYSIFLLLIVITGIFLRIIRLDFQSMWGDELYSLIPTNPSNSIKSLIEYCKSDQPPLYFVLLHNWFKIVPYNEYMGRLLSVIVGMLGILVMYFLGKEVKDKTVGIFASFITTFNYFHIYYSQELRFYSLLFLLTVLSYLFFIKSLKNPKPLNYIYYCIFSIGMIYTHYFGPVVVISQGIIFLVFVALGRRDWQFIVYSIGSGLIILAAYLPWMPTIFNDTKIQEIWIAKPSPLFFGLYFYMYLGKDPFLAILFIFFIGLFIRQFIKRNTLSIDQTETPDFIRDRFIILTVWIVIGYLIPYLYSITMIPVLEARYTIIVLPALFVIFSIGLSLVKNYKIQAALLASIVLSSAINLLFFNQYYTKPIKDQLREAAQVVISNYEKPTKVYTTMAYFYNYYFEKSGKDIIAVNPTMWYPGQSPAEANFETELADEKEVWIMQGGPLIALKDYQQAYLDKYFVIVKRFDFKGAYVILYRRK